MTSWKIERLEKLCTIQTGGTPSRQNPEYFLGNIPWITTVALGPVHIDEKKAAAFLTDKAVQESATKIIPSSSLLVGIRVGVGKTSINDCAIATNQDIAALTNIDERCDIEYLQRVLRKYGSYFDLIKRGATIQGITTEVLRQLEIPLPPIETQRKIAAILDTAQELIDLRKVQLEKLDEFLRSVFLDMFGDPVANSKDWLQDRLDNIAEVVSGVTKGRKIPPDKVVQVPYMRVANVQDGHLVLDEIKTIEVLPSDIEKFKLVEGDLLATEGGDPDKLGRCAIWKGQIADCIHQNHIFRIRSERKKIVPEYLCYLIGSNYGKKYFLRASKQTTGIASINSTQLKAFPAYLPPLPLQTQFAAIVEATEAQKALMQQSLAEMENSFNSLMQRAFRGELF